MFTPDVLFLMVLRGILCRKWRCLWKIVNNLNEQRPGIPPFSVEQIHQHPGHTGWIFQYDLKTCQPPKPVFWGGYHISQVFFLKLVLSKQTWQLNWYDECRCISRAFVQWPEVPGRWSVPFPGSQFLFSEFSQSTTGFHRARRALILIPLFFIVKKTIFTRTCGMGVSGGSPTSRPHFLGRWQVKKVQWTWSTLPETNRQFALENHHRNPGKYHQNGGFSMAMLVYRSIQYTWIYVIIQLSPGKSRCQHITFKLPSQKFGRWGVPFQRWGSSFSLPGI